MVDILLFFPLPTRNRKPCKIPFSNRKVGIDGLAAFQDGILAFWLSLDDFASQYDEKAEAAMSVVNGNL